MAASAFAMQAEEVVLSVADATDIEGELVEAAGNTKEHYQPVTALRIGEYAFALSTSEAATNAPALYHANSTPTLRMYTGAIITITAPESMNMSTVTFTCASVKGVSANNLPTCSLGGTITVDGTDIVWNRPDTEEVINTITISLPDTKDGNTNPNVQVKSFTISSEVSDTPDVPEPTVNTYVLASEITPGANYLIYAEGKIAEPIAADKTYGYLYVADATVENGEIKADPANAFKIDVVEGGYSIQQADGRYLYQKGTYNSFNLVDALPMEGSVWSIEIDDERSAVITNLSVEKSIQFDTNYGSFGSYPDVRGIYPQLYVEKTSAIESIAVEADANAPVEYYNLQGVRVNANELPAGIYVRRQGNTTAKVLVK